MPRFRDSQGRFVKTPHHLKTNPSSSGADSLGNTTPAEEVIQTLAKKIYSGQELTLIERETLLTHKSQKKHFPRSSTQGESSTVTEQYFFNLLFKSSDTDTEKPIRMAEEGDGSVPNLGRRDEEESTFKLPIHEPQEDDEIKMKNIPPSVLPNFYRYGFGRPRLILVRV